MHCVWHFVMIDILEFSVSNAMKTAPAASNVNLEMQRYYAGQNYREAAGAAPAPGPGWPGAGPYEAAHPGNLLSLCSHISIIERYPAYELF